MGDYVYMRGTAKIKQELQEVVRPLFGEPRYEKRARWTDLALSEELKSSKYMRGLIEASYDGQWYPDSWGSALAGFGADNKQRGTGVLTFSEDGVLEFATSSKNSNNVQENFAALLILLSDSYEIEQDYHETAFEINFEHDQVYSWSSDHTQSQLLIGALFRERLKIEKRNPLKRYRVDSMPNGSSWKLTDETREFSSKCTISAEDFDDPNVVAAANELIAIEDTLAAQELANYLPVYRRAQLKKFNRQKKQRRARCR